MLGSVRVIDAILLVCVCAFYFHSRSRWISRFAFRTPTSVRHLLPFSSFRVVVFVQVIFFSCVFAICACVRIRWSERKTITWCRIASECKQSAPHSERTVHNPTELKRGMQFRYKVYAYGVFSNSKFERPVRTEHLMKCNPK